MFVTHCPCFNVIYELLVKLTFSITVLFVMNFLFSITMFHRMIWKTGPQFRPAKLIPFGGAACRFSLEGASQ